MHLVDYSVGSISAFAGLAATFATAVLALFPANTRTARVLLWAAALSFGSSGIVWSATSEGYSLPVQMIVSAIIAGIAAAGLTWSLSMINETERKVQANNANGSIGNQPSPANAAPTGPTFMRVAPGASVEGLTIRGAQIEGTQTDFDIGGRLKNADIQNFKSTRGSSNSAYIEHLHIGRVTTDPPPKIGVVQPSWPVNEPKNQDGTVFSTMTFRVDDGITLNLLVGIKATSLIDYEILRDGHPIEAPKVQTDTGFIARKLINANGVYSMRIHRKNTSGRLEVRFQPARN